MIGYAQTQKNVLMSDLSLTLVSVNQTASAVGTDTIGWDYLTVDFWIDPAAAATNVITTCKLAESVDNTTFSDIVAFTGGTVTSATVGFVLPTVSDTSDAYSFRMNVDLRKRERYIKAFCTPSVAAQNSTGTTTNSPAQTNAASSSNESSLQDFIIQCSFVAFALPYTRPSAWKAPGLSSSDFAIQC